MSPKSNLVGNPAEPLSNEYSPATATLSGLERKVVDKVFAELKKTGEVVSLVRCKWTPAE